MREQWEFTLATCCHGHGPIPVFFRSCPSGIQRASAHGACVVAVFNVLPTSWGFSLHPFSKSVRRRISSRRAVGTIKRPHLDGDLAYSVYSQMCTASDWGIGGRCEPVPALELLLDHLW